VRSDEKPFRAESSNPCAFRAWANHSYPEGKTVATVRQHGADGSSGPGNEIAQTKDAERRDKVSVHDGKVPDRRQRSDGPFQNVGDVPKHTAGL